VLAGAHKKFERRRPDVQKCTYYSLEAQEEGKIEVPHDMVSFHLFFILFLPDWNAWFKQ
jgi:hypothetical protein